MKSSIKAFAFLAFLILGLAITGLADVVRRQDSWLNLGTCKYECPSDHPYRAEPPDQSGEVACDPAFITYDRKWAALKQVVAEGRELDASARLSNTSADIEKALAKAMDAAKAPDLAWAVAMDAWRSNVSSAFQRQALALIRAMAKPPANSETLNFMLSALDNPVAEVERCREWGRGSLLERRKAADHLAILLQNPNLANRLK